MSTGSDGGRHPGHAGGAVQDRPKNPPMRDNLVRSIADGAAFLDHFEVAPLEDGQAIAVIDNEMNGQAQR